MKIVKILTITTGANAFFIPQWLQNDNDLTTTAIVATTTCRLQQLVITRLKAGPPQLQRPQRNSHQQQILLQVIWVQSLPSLLSKVPTKKKLEITPMKLLEVGFQMHTHIFLFFLADSITDC